MYSTPPPLKNVIFILMFLCISSNWNQKFIIKFRSLFIENIISDISRQSFVVNILKMRIFSYLKNVLQEIEVGIVQMEEYIGQHKCGETAARTSAFQVFLLPLIFVICDGGKITISFVYFLFYEQPTLQLIFFLKINTCIFQCNT